MVNHSGCIYMEYGQPIQTFLMYRMDAFQRDHFCFRFFNFEEFCKIFLSQLC